KHLLPQKRSVKLVAVQVLQFLFQTLQSLAGDLLLDLRRIKLSLRAVGGQRAGALTWGRTWLTASHPAFSLLRLAEVDNGSRAYLLNPFGRLLVVFADRFCELLPLVVLGLLLGQLGDFHRDKIVCRQPFGDLLLPV